MSEEESRQWVMIFITAVCHIHKGRPRHVLLQTLVLLSRYPRESIYQMPRAIRNAFPSVKAPWSVNFVLWASAPVFLDSGPERGTKQSAHNHRNHAVSYVISRVFNPAFSQCTNLLWLKSQSPLAVPFYQFLVTVFSILFAILCVWFASSSLCGSV